VYAHHHPAAIGLPYPPRPGSGSGLRPKPFIAKGPVLASDAVPEGEKREFEAQAEGEKGEFEEQVAAVEVEVEVDDEGLRQEQGERGKVSTSTGPYISSITILSGYCHAMPYHAMLSYAMSYHIIPHNFIQCHVISYNAMAWHAMLIVFTLLTCTPILCSVLT
jgi:hypothetical protein